MLPVVFANKKTKSLKNDKKGLLWEGLFYAYKLTNTYYPLTKLSTAIIPYTLNIAFKINDFCFAQGAELGISPALKTVSNQQGVRDESIISIGCCLDVRICFGR